MAIHGLEPAFLLHLINQPGEESEISCDFENKITFAPSTCDHSPFIHPTLLDTDDLPECIKIHKPPVEKSTIL